jgi:hypothetical protein
LHAARRAKFRLPHAPHRQSPGRPAVAWSAAAPFGEEVPLARFCAYLTAALLLPAAPPLEVTSWSLASGAVDGFSPGDASERPAPPSAPGGSFLNLSRCGRAVGDPKCSPAAPSTPCEGVVIAWLYSLRSVFCQAGRRVRKGLADFAVHRFGPAARVATMRDQGPNGDSTHVAETPAFAWRFGCLERLDSSFIFRRRRCRKLQLRDGTLWSFSHGRCHCFRIVALLGDSLLALADPARPSCLPLFWLPSPRAYHRACCIGAISPRRWHWRGHASAPLSPTAPRTNAERFRGVVVAKGSAQGLRQQQLLGSRTWKHREVF